MEATAYHQIQDSSRQLYVDDPRPWLVGYSDGKPLSFTTKPPRAPSQVSSFIHHPSAFFEECPIQIDTSTPSCGNSRFGCWTCTVVERDKVWLN